MERVVDIADAAVKHMEHVVHSPDLDETGKEILLKLQQFNVVNKLWCKIFRKWCDAAQCQMGCYNVV